MSTSAIPVASGRLPLLGHALSLARGSRLEYLRSLRRFGDVVAVHLGPKPVYVVTSPELVHQLLVVDAKKFAKGLLFDRARPYMGNGLLTSSGEFHKRQRRMIQPAFHRDHVNRHVDRMREATRQLTDTWRPGQVIAVEQEMYQLATATITRTMFTTGPAEELAALVQRWLPQFVAGVGKRTLTPVPLVFRVPTPANRRFDQAAARLRDVTRDLVATARREHHADRDDMVSRLLAGHDDSGTAMSEQQVVDEILTLLIAGIETTATTLTWAYYELGRRPDLRERLHDEVDTVLDGQPVRSDDLPRLRFTGALVQEVLRRHSPTWLLMRRAQETVDLGPFRIPSGSEVIYSPTIIHHDPRLYPDPLRFDPNRWLTHHEPPHAGRGFIPFGAGTHKCIGETFARNELHTVLATTAERWQLEPVPEHRIKTSADGVVHIRHLPMATQYRKRNHHRK